MSDFAEWFEAQHGPRGNHAFRRLTDDQLSESVAAGLSARQELDRRQRWDAQRQSALYAWQARETRGGNG